MHRFALVPALIALGSCIVVRPRVPAMYSVHVRAPAPGEEPPPGPPPSEAPAGQPGPPPGEPPPDPRDARRSPTAPGRNPFPDLGPQLTDQQLDEIPDYERGRQYAQGAIVRESYSSQPHIIVFRCQQETCDGEPFDHGWVPAGWW